MSTSSPAEDVDAVRRMFRLPKGEQRMLSVRGHGNVISLAGADAFFALPEGGSGAAFSHSSNPMKQTVSGACQRSGNLASVKGSSTYIVTTTTFVQRALLGGVLPLDGISSEGAFKNTNSEIVAVESVYGAPFPLMIGKRFGIKYTLASSAADGGDPVPVALHCAVTDVRISAPTPALGSAPQMICVSQAATYQIVTRWAFDEGSGCAIGMRTQTY